MLLFPSSLIPRLPPVHRGEPGNKISSLVCVKYQTTLCKVRDPAHLLGEPPGG